MSDELTDVEEQAFEKICEALTDSVKQNEICPIDYGQIVFPMVAINPNLTPEGAEGFKDEMAKQFHLGCCLKGLINKKVAGIRFAKGEDAFKGAMGWVVQIESPLAPGTEELKEIFISDN